MKHPKVRHTHQENQSQKWLCILLTFLFCSGGVSAQESILKKITPVAFNNIELSHALDSLARRTNMYFTYNSRLIDDTKRISLHSESMPLQTVLDSILQDHRLRYHILRKQIIITKEDSSFIYEAPLATSQGYHLRGKIFDSRTKKPLSYVNIGVRGKMKGTVTNAEGDFSLSFLQDEIADTIQISYIGYHNTHLILHNTKDSFVNLWLNPKSIPLQEVIIRTNDPLILLKSALSKIKENYSQSPLNYTSFYRESVKKNKTYTSYLESILDIYTSAYQQINASSTARVLKSRKIYDQEKRDTVSFRLQGGVEASMNLDIVKYPADFLNNDWFKYFDYSLIDIDSYNDRPVYVIDCRQRKGLSTVFQNGRLFIDVQNLAIVMAEIYYPEKKVSQLSRKVITKKASRLRATPTQIKYQVHYREINGTYYYSHALGQLKFRVKSKRRIFTSTFHIKFELANTHIHTENVHRIPYKERLRPREILSQRIMDYDTKFWEGQTYIYPEQDIQEAIKQIKPFIEQTVSEGEAF